MKMFLLSVLIKFMDLDNICKALAKCIAVVLSYASKRGGKAWDVAKDVITKVNLWTSLFVQVYDDDNMMVEEEKLVADAIKNRTNIAKVVDILKSMKDESKKTS